MCTDQRRGAQHGINAFNLFLRDYLRSANFIPVKRVGINEPWKRIVLQGDSNVMTVVAPTWNSVDASWTFLEEEEEGRYNEISILQVEIGLSGRVYMELFLIIRMDRGCLK